MISKDEALAICEKHFPDGLDHLIRLAGVRMLPCRMSCDGWGFRTAKGLYKIRYNSDATRQRKRFTIAHELSHFILHSNDVAPLEPVPLLGYNFSSPTEREANDLASALLLPVSYVTGQVQGGLVKHDIIKRMAKRAKVSEVVVAIRLRGMGKLLKLDKPFVFFLDDPSTQSIVFPSMPISYKKANWIYSDLKSKNKSTHKYKGDSICVVATALSNPNSRTLFVHRIDASTIVTSPERTRLDDLKRQILKISPKFYQSLTGCISSWADKNRSMNLQELYDGFCERYDVEEKWQNGMYEFFCKTACKEFVYLKLRERVEGK